MIVVTTANRACSIFSCPSPTLPCIIVIVVVILPCFLRFGIEIRPRNTYKCDSPSRSSFPADSLPPSLDRFSINLYFPPYPPFSCSFYVCTRMHLFTNLCYIPRYMHSRFIIVNCKFFSQLCLNHFRNIYHFL